MSYNISRQIYFIIVSSQSQSCEAIGFQIIYQRSDFETNIACGLRSSTDTHDIYKQIPRLGLGYN